MYDSQSGGYEVDYEEPGSSLPWQDRSRYSSWVAAMWETIKAVLFNPVEAFSNMKAEGTLGESLVFVLILGTASGILGNVWGMLFRSCMRGAVPGGAAASPLQALGISVGLGVEIALVLVFLPVMVVVASFITAGILHLCLMVLGGANRSFEATYAVIAYATGCTAVFNVIPMCGGLVAGIWCIVVEILGLREAHGTTTGKAVGAVFLPLIACCGLIILLVVLLGAAMVSVRG